MILAQSELSPHLGPKTSDVGVSRETRDRAFTLDASQHLYFNSNVSQY